MAVSPSPTVFLIDDDAPVRDALSRLLRAHRFAVAAFASPKEFLEHYNPDTPGCLVLDLKMRGNGFGLQRTLQEKGSCRPIIFLTGHGDIPKSVQAVKGGAVDFLTKPVNDKDLLAAVRVAIEKDRTLRREQTDLSEIRARLATLTPCEREVLEYVVTGKLPLAELTNGVWHKRLYNQHKPPSPSQGKARRRRARATRLRPNGAIALVRMCAMASSTESVA